MKIYCCDSYKKMIENPHKEKMKEFYIGTSLDIRTPMPHNTNHKIKIHLCDDCFRGLHKIAKKHI